MAAYTQKNLMKRTYKVGGIYRIASTRDGSSFRMFLRLVISSSGDEVDFRQHLYWEDFETGGLTPMNRAYQRYHDGRYEFEMPWAEMEVTELATDIKQFLSLPQEHLKPLL